LSAQSKKKKKAYRKIVLYTLIQQWEENQAITTQCTWYVSLFHKQKWCLDNL